MMKNHTFMYTIAAGLWLVVCLLITSPIQLATAADMDIAPAEPADPMTLPNMVPNKQETADSAFAKLDVGKKGHVTREDTKVLEGFADKFDAFDKNGDDKLNPDEFVRSWEAYSGIPSDPDNFQRTK